MLLTLPIYVEVIRHEGQPLHTCRPLFFSGPAARDPHLGLAIGKLVKRLKEWLDERGAAMRHDELAWCAFNPDVTTHVHKLTLDLRDERVRCRLLFVEFSALERRVVFSPSLPTLWFELRRGDTLEARATEVLTRHYRELRREHKGSSRDISLTPPTLEGAAWVTTIDLPVRVRQATQREEQKKLAALFDETKGDGGLELQRVGRCLDWLYPDELQRAVARDREARRLERLLRQPDNRPVALIGPRLVGKTTILHECVRRRVARRGRPYAARENVWLLSPQRLISGMMYVGQWEGRLQAILREARRRRHVLYFDDFHGLYQAGISRDAKLSAADVLRSWVLRRDVRVLAEMTGEAWQALQERDRGLADQFHVLRVDPLGEAETIRVMLEVQRQLEAERRCQFSLDALPLTLRLHAGHVRDAVFPGKSAQFARRLAGKHPSGKIGRQEVLAEFREQTGLSLELIDDRQRLDRDRVLMSLRARVVGQDEALGAAADVVVTAKAGLGDPARPLATLLFLGPTGVGKTQCAKALAEVMFRDPSRLLRFDMNECVTAHSAARLVGTLDEPDGLLTAAVRRQPFSVILLDEIEKAHPDVFDLLLQVTGEGRLTDAIGRTADFSNTVVVMTSNLGTSASRGDLGLVASERTRREVFIRAAESFFRPEFFNRIDRVVPFHTLDREQMLEVAELVLSEVRRREGLVRRRCVVSIEREAMQRLVDAGYHPQLGARALKRAVERQIVRPLAAGLASVRPERPTIVSVLPSPAGAQTQVRPLEMVEPARTPLGGLTDDDTERLAEYLELVRGFHDRVRDELEEQRPREGITAGALSPEQLRYYAVKEQALRLNDLVKETTESLRGRRRGGGAARGTSISSRSGSADPSWVARSPRLISPRPWMREIQAARDVHDFLVEAAEAAAPLGQLAARWTRIVREAALLQSLVDSRDVPDHVALVVRTLESSSLRWRFGMQRGLRDVGQLLGYASELVDCPSPDPRLLVVSWSGPGIWPLAQIEAGVHLQCLEGSALEPAQVTALPVVGDLQECLRNACAARDAWTASLAAGRGDPSADPWPWGPVVRLYNAGGSTVDLRSGAIALNAPPSTEEWRDLLLAGLAPPEELCAPAADEPPREERS